MSKYTLVVIGVALLFGEWSSVVVAQSIRIDSRERNQLDCEPIARVMNNGDRRHVAKSLICPKEQVEVVPGRIAEVLCYTGKLLELKTSTAITADKCKLKTVKVSPCTPGNPSLCDKPKGPAEEENHPKLIRPYSSSVLTNRPGLSWQKVAGATSYTVAVSAEDVDWQQTVTDTKLLYPNQKPALTPGSVAKVTIVASRGNAYLAESSAVLNVLTLNEAKQVQQVVEQIKNLNLPPDETAFDLNAVYNGQDLRTEAINVLTQRIRAGSRNPAIYRTLGDRYLESGLPTDAKREYTQAAKIAQIADNEAELAKAQAGLRRASLHSQLPTRINGSQ